jgi:transcriptional regulator with XRE-family HTH domain
MLGNKKIMGINILRLLEQNGIERKEFAKIIGVPYSTLTNWINGTTYPRIDKIQKMADYFGIEKKDLVEEWKPGITPTSRELELIVHYRSADPWTCIAVDKLLDMQDDDISTPIAAHAHDDATPDQLASDAEMLRKAAEKK